MVLGNFCLPSSGCRCWVGRAVPKRALFLWLHCKGAGGAEGAKVVLRV